MDSNGVVLNTRYQNANLVKVCDLYEPQRHKEHKEGLIKVEDFMVGNLFQTCFPIFQRKGAKAQRHKEEFRAIARKGVQRFN